MLVTVHYKCIPVAQVNMFHAEVNGIKVALIVEGESGYGWQMILPSEYIPSGHNKTLRAAQLCVEEELETWMTKLINLPVQVQTSTKTSSTSTSSSGSNTTGRRGHSQASSQSSGGGSSKRK